MSWRCPKCNSENSDFIIEDMRKTKCLCGYDLLSEEPHAEKNEKNMDLTSIDLYAQAYLLNESKTYNKLLEVCTILLNKFPDSKETKWAVKEFPIKWDRDKKLISYYPKKFPEAFSWKSFLIAFLVTIIITFIAAAANPGAKPTGFHWTLVWMLLTVSAWKYWRWKALAPYPAFLLCSSLVSVVVVVAGGDMLDFRIVGAAMNIIGITIFSIIYYRRFRKERTILS